MEFFLGGRQVKEQNNTSAAVTPRKMILRREVLCLFRMLLPSERDTGHPHGSGPAMCSASIQAYPVQAGVLRAAPGTLQVREFPVENKVPKLLPRTLS